MTISSWLNFGRPVPPGRGLRRSEMFWFRLATASAQCLRLSERFFHFIMGCVREAKHKWTVTERRYFLISSLFALHCKNMTGEKSSTYLFHDLVLSPIFEHHVCKHLTTRNSLPTSVTWSTPACSNGASSWIFVTFRRHDTTLTNATKV